MIQKTKGIVLSHLKYKDSSIIIRVFTENFGLRTYIVNGVRKKNKGNKMIYYQPLNIVEMVVYENEQKSINRISEIKFYHQPYSIPFNTIKTTIAIFLCEFFEKIILDGEINEELYHLIEAELIQFDKQENAYENFPIYLLIKLTNVMGIHIGVDNSNSIILTKLMQNDFEALNGKLRKELLEELIAHYNKHLGTSKNINSLEVLSTVLE